MKIEQVSVYLENRAGSLAEATVVLAEAGIRIITLALSDVSDFGVMRMIVPDARKARDILKRQGLTSSITEVVAVEVTDNPGGMHRTLASLTGSGINIEYMYAFMAPGARTIMIFKFDDMDRAIELMGKDGAFFVDQRHLCQSGTTSGEAS